MKVSILMATYDREQIIDRALSSLRDQSFKDFELIVINEGKSIIGKLDGLKYKYIQCNEKTTLPHSLYLGYKIAEGDYITFLDDDDIMYPNALYDMLSGFTEDRIKAVYANCRREFTKIGKSEIFPNRDIMLSKNNIMSLNWAVNCAKMYRHDALIESEAFEGCQSTTLEDWEYSLAVSKKFGIGSWKYINKIVSEVYVTDKSMTSNMGKQMNEDGSSVSKLYRNTWK